MGNVLGTDDGSGGRRVRRLDGRVVYTTCPECGCGPGDCCTGNKACVWDIDPESPTPPTLRITGSMKHEVWAYDNLERGISHPLLPDGPFYRVYEVPMDLVRVMVASSFSSEACNDISSPSSPPLHWDRDPPGTDWPFIEKITFANVQVYDGTSGVTAHFIDIESRFIKGAQYAWGGPVPPDSNNLYDMKFGTRLRIEWNLSQSCLFLLARDIFEGSGFGGLALGRYILRDDPNEELIVTPIYSGRCVVGWNVRLIRDRMLEDTIFGGFAGRYRFEFIGAILFDNVAGCDELAPSAPDCMGACCEDDGSCSQRTQADCLAVGGQWFPNQDCADIPCGCIPKGPCIVWGGVFTSAGGAPAARIVAWDGVNWHPLGDGFNSAVQSLAVHDGRLHAAGAFTLSGGATVRGVARWNCDHWEEVGGGLLGVINRLKSIDVPLRGRTLFAVGNFSIGGANNVVWLDPSSNTWQPWTDGTNLEAYDISSNEIDEDLGAGEQLRPGNGLFVAGRFTASGSGANPVLNNLAFDPQFQKLVMIEPTGAPGLAPNGRARAVLSRFANPGSGGVISIAGVFTSVGGVAKGLVANLLYDPIDNRYKTIVGGPLGLGTGFANGEVHYLVWSSNQLGPNLYALGQFRFIAGFPTDAVARWNTTTQNWVVPTGYSGTFFHGCWAAHPVTGVPTLWCAGDTLRVVDGQSGRAAYLAPSGQVDPIPGHLMNGQAFAVIGFDFGDEVPPAPGSRPGRRGCLDCGREGEEGVRQVT